VGSSVFAPEVWVVREVGAHAVAGSVKAARHSAGGDAERGGGLVIGEAVDVDELNDL